MTVTNDTYIHEGKNEQKQNVCKIRKNGGRWRMGDRGKKTQGAERRVKKRDTQTGGASRDGRMVTGRGMRE